MSSKGVAVASTAVGGDVVAPSDVEWQAFWRGHSVASEIAMADFYGLRHVLLKFLPRAGTVIEAGCGLGRYVFYFRALGLHVVGYERLLAAARGAHRWAQRARPEDAGVFGAADVRELPVRDGCLSGYVSLGVIEHFPEGPAGAIAEAYRVLRPGGVAVIEVPSARAFDGYVHRLKRGLGSMIGRRRAHTDAMHEEPLAPAVLGTLLEQAGFTVLFCSAVDLIYPAWSLGFSRRWYGALQRVERTPLANWGGLAVAVGLKPGTDMACFVCGASAGDGSTMAFCAACRNQLPADVIAAYSPARVGDVRWQSLDCSDGVAGGPCSVCGAAYEIDGHFGDWGFAVPVCRQCVRQASVNLTLAQRAVKRVWRPRARGTA